MAKSEKTKSSGNRQSPRPKSRSAAHQDASSSGLERLGVLIQSYPGTNAELAKAAKVAPSTISMIIGGSRAPSVKVTARLAKVLCPPDRSLEQFTKEVLELAGHEPTAAAYSGVSESVAERVRRTGKIRAGYVVSDPFVYSKQKGFAAELFQYVAALIGAEIEPYYYGISELRSALERGQVDIIVSAVLPTFQRRNYMWFSKPFPYLRVPLSALVREGTKVKEGSELAVEHVLNWTTNRDGLGRVKITLVDGEVGHDFVKTFLPHVRGTDIELVKTLEPEALSRILVDDPTPDLLFIADKATCVAVNKLSKGFRPLPDDSPVAKYIRSILEHRDDFPVLALYPITFGLPKGDEDWQDTIDRALLYLMSEGARILLTLYHRYFESDKFREFCVGDDELVDSEFLREAFGKLLHPEEESHDDATKLLEIVKELGEIARRLQGSPALINETEG